MKLLVAVINNDKHLTPVLDKFYDLGIKGATVINSQGMGHLIADHIPYFYRFAELVKPGQSENKTIFSVIQNEDTLNQAIEEIDCIVGGLNNSNTGFVFTMSIDQVAGFPDTKN